MAQDTAPAPVDEAPAPSGQDAPAPSTTPSPEQSAPPSPDGAATSTETDPAASSASDATDRNEGAAPEADWRRAVKDVDPDELLKDRRIGGIVGERAKRQAEAEINSRLPTLKDELRAEIRRELEQERERQDRLQAAKEGRFYDLGEKVGQQLLTEEEQAELDRQRRAAERDLEQATYGRVNATLEEWAKPLGDDLLAAAAQKFQEKAPAGGDYNASLRAYLDTLFPLAVEAEVQKHLAAERAKWETDVLPALQAEALAKVNGGQPAPETQEGSSARTREFTDEDISRMPMEEYLAITGGRGIEGLTANGHRYRPTRAIDPRSVAQGVHGAPVSSR